MTGLKSGIFHTPFRTPFASRLIHICVDLQEIRTSDAHPQIPQEPCGRKDTEAFAHLRGQPQNPQEGRAACTNPVSQKVPGTFSFGHFFCQNFFRHLKNLRVRPPSLPSIRSLLNTYSRPLRTKNARPRNSIPGPRVCILFLSASIPPTLRIVRRAVD